MVGFTIRNFYRLNLFSFLFLFIYCKSEEFINGLLEKKEWLKALKVALEIYKGNLRLFADILSEPRVDKEKWRPFIEGLARRYVETLKPGSVTEFGKERETETQIINTLEFLISIECFDFLFSEIKDLYQSLNLQSMMISCLEPFILKNRVKQVPNEFFREIANFFKSKRKIKIIELLIINLDIDALDPEFIISLCLDFHLFKALIYICNRLDNDFITPLVKLFMVYKEKLEKDGAEAKEFGYICLWYIKISLQGVIFPNDLMDDELYAIVVKNMVVWVFIEENIRVLIDMDIDSFFPVIFLFFSAKASKILQELNDSLVKINSNLL